MILNHDHWMTTARLPKSHKLTRSTRFRDMPSSNSFLECIFVKSGPHTSPYSCQANDRSVCDIAYEPINDDL
jgi:hypothetical protein